MLGEKRCNLLRRRKAAFSHILKAAVYRFQLFIRRFIWLGVFLLERKQELRSLLLQFLGPTLSEMFLRLGFISSL